MSDPWAPGGNPATLAGQILVLEQSETLKARPETDDLMLSLGRGVGAKKVNSLASGSFAAIIPVQPDVGDSICTVLNMPMRGIPAIIPCYIRGKWTFILTSPKHSAIYHSPPSQQLKIAVTRRLRRENLSTHAQSRLSGIACRTRHFVKTYVHAIRAHAMRKLSRARSQKVTSSFSNRLFSSERYEFPMHCIGSVERGMRTQPGSTKVEAKYSIVISASLSFEEIHYVFRTFLLS